MAKKEAQKKKIEIVTIPPLKTDTLKIKIIGDTPLITHAWSEKAKKEMLDKQMKKAKQGREAKDPDRDYRESLYWLDKNNNRIAVKDVDPNKHHLFGFKTIAFKAAAVRAANDVGLQMTLTRRSFHIIGEFVPIKCDRILMREDMVRIGMGVADLRYRAEFQNWSTVLQIIFNARIISPEQIFNLLNTAGFGVGVGEWRPERNGVNGMFHVE